MQQVVVVGKYTTESLPLTAPPKATAFGPECKLELQ